MAIESKEAGYIVGDSSSLRLAATRIRSVPSLRQDEWPTAFADQMVVICLELASIIVRAAESLGRAYPLSAGKFAAIGSAVSAEAGRFVEFARSIGEAKAVGNLIVRVPGLGDFIPRFIESLARAWDDLDVLARSQPIVFQLTRLSPFATASGLELSKSQAQIEHLTRTLWGITVPEFPGQRIVHGPPAPDYEELLEQERRRARRQTGKGAWAILAALAVLGAGGVWAYRRYAG